MTTALDRLKRLLPQGLRQDLKRRLFHVNDMHSRLANLRSAGFRCSGAIDGGAYAGDWTHTFWRSFPGVPVIIIEPLPSQKDILHSLASRMEGSRFVEAALGSTAGHAQFRIAATNSGVISNRDSGETEPIMTVRVTTLDDVLRAASPVAPNLLKLDLQGYELECLRGCSRLSSQFEVIILEVSVLPIGDVPIFRDVDHFLEHEHFRIYDILPQYYRPLDGALWQCDVFYVRDDSDLVRSRRWA